MIFIFFILLGLPLFFVRMVVFKKPFSFFVIGLSQDLFILGQQFILFLLIKSLFAFSVPIAFYLMIMASFSLHINTIFDGFLYRQTGVRLEAAFISFLNDLRSFWDSAKERGFWLILPLGAAVLGFNAFIFSFYDHLIEPFHLTRENIAIYLLVILPGILGECFISKKILYGISNVTLQQQIWVFKKLFSFITRKNDLAGFNRESIRKLFPLKNEKATYFSETYSLLKYTHGFEGKTQFHIPIKEGEKPHIILLFMESFRAKDVGSIMGKEPSTTPYFDALAKEGILFRNFYSNSIKTSRAVTASLFGIPSDVDSSNTSNKVDLPLIGIADILKSQGYETAYVHNGMLQFENQLEFFKNHNFDTVLGKEDILEKYPKAPSTSWGVHDEFLMKYAVDLFSERFSKPTFMTIFTITNHHPWTSPPGFGAALPKLNLQTAYKRYLQTFSYSDYSLGLFLNMLKKTGLSKKSIIFILGDHGQPMGEHNQNFSSQNGLYDENVHIPLLILADGRIENPKQIDTPCSQIDLLPTILDILKLQGFNHSVGNSLMREKVFFHNPYVYGFFGCRKGQYKLIHSMAANETELYHLENDPHETVNIAESHPIITRELLEHVTLYQRLFKTVYQNKLIVDPNAQDLILEPTL